MHLPPGGSLKDLDLPEWDPAHRAGPVAGVLTRLAWSRGLTRPRPAFRAMRIWDERIHRLNDLVAPGATRPADPGHLVNCDLYHSRRFVVGEGRDIGMLRYSAAVFAPDKGVIDEFNVGGAEYAPTGLIDSDLAGVRAGGIERVPGLSVPFCHYGYPAFGHFILDGLLQVWLFREELASGEAKLVYWPMPANTWMEPLLDHCGVPASARRVLRRQAALFERAGLSTALAGHGVYFPEAFSIDFFGWLRTVLTGQTQADPQACGRVYVRRLAHNTRQVLNQPALEAFLEARGFTIIDPLAMDVPAQAQAIANAEVMVTPWGSGATLSPLLGGARKVIELTPDTMSDQWYIRQAAVHGLGYWPVVHKAGPADEISVDFAELERALAWAGA